MGLLPFLVVPMLKRKGSLPYMNVPQHKIITLFQRVLPRHLAAQTQRPRRFVDLGHGFGEAVLSATQHGYVATGVELNPTLYLLSVCNAWRQGVFVPFDKRARLVWGDLWKREVRLGEQDVVMMFGVAGLMGRLTAKVRAEAKDDALVVLYRFQLSLPPAMGERTDKKDERDIELLEVADEWSVYRVQGRRKEDESKTQMH